MPHERIRAAAGVFGKPCQYIEYLPFGEIMVQQSTNNIFENVYKFNAKELDESTGYYYYGARYYDPDTSVFLSVDPLAEKYPSYSPYIYTFNDPINYIDPDGRDGVRVIDRKNRTITIKAVYYVQTEARVTRSGNVRGYASREIARMERNTNAKLNRQKISVNEGEYNGYDIKFNLSFKEGGLV